MGQVHAPATFRYLLWGSSNINLDITLSPDLLKKKSVKVLIFPTHPELN